MRDLGEEDEVAPFELRGTPAAQYFLLRKEV